MFKRKLYYAVRNSWLVWFYFLNNEGRNLYKKSNLRLDEVQKRVVRDLESDGIALASLEELFGRREVLNLLQNYARGLESKAEVKTKKVFLKNLFERVPLLDLENPFVKLALDEKILNVVAGYLRMFPKFRGLTLNLTTPMLEEALPVDSQRWHRDPEDKIVVKMFLYLTDVDESSGPFIYVRSSHHLGRHRRLFPTAPPAGSYPPLGAVEEKIFKDDIKINTGKAGTIIFCETSGLHKGGHATKKERLMFTSIYASRAATSPKVYKIPDILNLSNPKLSLLVNYALDN